MNGTDRGGSGWIPTDQTSHDTTYGWRDTEQMRDRIRIQKLVLPNK